MNRNVESHFALNPTRIDLSRSTFDRSASVKTSFNAGDIVPFFLEEYRFRSDTVVLVKFVDYDNAEEARELCGCEVYFPFALTPDEAPEEITWSYFTGFSVKDINAGMLGTVDSVDESTSNVLFQIGEKLIPAAEDFIVDVDHANRQIVMRLPDGLLEL